MSAKRTFATPKVASNTVAELSAKLIEANNKLNKAEQERTAMLENISHDLRAPLTAMRSAIDYLKQKNESGELLESPGELADMLKLIDDRAGTLEVLIRDLYYLTCIESGRDDLELVSLPLEQLLEEYFFSVEIDEKFADKKMSLKIPEGYDRTVNVDVGKISRVLDNLFNNARKYSQKGDEIILGVVEDSDKACFYVKDTGIGIPEEAITHIFDRTYRVSNARTPGNEVSSGLGLSIVKTIVEQHGGKVWCESKAGAGSCFYVELPVT